MERIICEAIKNKQIITFEYNYGIRTVEPFLLGISTQENKVLRAFQLKNSNKLQEKSVWRMFDLSGIKRIQLTTDHFNGIRNDYNKNDKAMKKIICELRLY
jgi:hypothetical protein